MHRFSLTIENQQAQVISLGPKWQFFPSKCAEMFKTWTKTHPGAGLQTISGETGK